MFGHERLEDCFVENKDKKPAQIKEAVLARLEQHCNGHPYDDDLTLVVVKAL
jgi:serine phosphatase RsbU (regulator of sigma subunit)